MDENNKNQDHFSIISTSGWSKSVREKRQADEEKRHSEIKVIEGKLIEEIKKRNAESRKLIKGIGFFFVLPIWALSIFIKSSAYDLLLTIIFWLSFIATTFLWIRYEHYKKAGIQICRGCLEEFALKENNSDKLCPYCGSGNSSAYL